MRRRHPFALAVTAGLAITLAPAAQGEGIEDLPPITADDLERSVLDINPQIRDMSVDRSVSDLEETSTEGRTTRVVLDTDILFAFGDDRLSDEAGERLGELVEDAPDGAEVTIVGHTDSIGSDEDNQDLSERRAAAVEEALATERPDLELKATGKGESDPVEPNIKAGKDHPEGRAANRRVEVTFEG